MSVISISASAVQAASDSAIVLVEPRVGGLEVFIVEREPDGGIIHPSATESHQCYPVSLLKNGETYVPGGDWTVIPYVKNSADGPSLYGRDGGGFSVNWVA